MRCVLLVFPAILGLSASFTSAQSRLIFPRLSFEARTLTGIAALNPNGTPPLVTFIAYDDGGQIIEAPGFENRREITIDAGLQFAEVIVALFGSGPADTVGWIEATSLSSDLTGFFLYLNLPDNQISDLAPLAGLTNLESLFLSDNQISDISALVANMGLGEGDQILLGGNLLDVGDCGSINALVARGVAVNIAAGLCG